MNRLSVRSRESVFTACRSRLAMVCLFLLGAFPARADLNRWSVDSPDGSCRITLHLGEGGRLSYQVARAGRNVLQDSPLGLMLGDESFERGLRFRRVSAVVRHRERYELFSGIAPQVDRLLHRRSVEFHNGNQTALMVDLAASDQGVAFRYRFATKTGGMQEVSEERTGFRLSSGARGWLQPYHAAGPYTPAYEDFYFRVSPGDAPPVSRHEPRGWCFPALFEEPSAKTWLLITETSGEDPYPACHLGPDSAGGLYRIAFPRQDERGDEGAGNEPARPRHTLPWTMPWRVIVLGADAGEIATSTLVTDLAPPSRVADTSWIRPGRASWAWWSHPDGPFTTEVFNEFTDLAATMGWEYTLFDANWWKPGIAPLVRHAKSRGIAPMIWAHAAGLQDPGKRRRKLDEIVADGACGLKADFWCSDRQETIETMKALFEEAGERKLMINLHGCTLPRGWHRTWPHFMTAEAVLGGESYLFERRFSEKAAELNTVLPFTRNVAGPMDYTPAAISPQRYPRATTAAHEWATAIIFTSGIIHYADRPGVFEQLPQAAVQVFRDAPARWDETRCLIGDPGRLAVFARRAGTSWFVAGISGSGDPQPVSLNLAAFRQYRRQILMTEGEDAKQQVEAKAIKTSAEWRHTIPPRGGFILRLDP